MKKQPARRGNTSGKCRADGPHTAPPPPITRDEPLRDRIKELRRVRAADLLPHPLNWRVHPPRQRAILEPLLRKIGFADALLARELPDGRLQLIDGHLRAETSPEMQVPVLVLDVDEAEAEQLLATLDPLAALAEMDAQAVATLHERIAAQEAEVARFLQDVQGEASLHDTRLTEAREDAPPVAPLELASLYQVIAECADEAAQKTLFERLVSEGYHCRALVL